MKAKAVCLSLLVGSLVLPTSLGAVASQTPTEVVSETGATEITSEENVTVGVDDGVEIKLVVVEDNVEENDVELCNASEVVATTTIAVAEDVQAITTEKLEEEALKASTRAKLYKTSVKMNKVVAAFAKRSVKSAAQAARAEEKRQEEEYINSLFAKGSNVPNDASGCKSQFKSWMRATSISARKSGQWKILHSENCYEDPDTHFMMYTCEDGEARICCALGSYYTELIGTKVDILFEDGHYIKCILADQKANQHTDKSNRYHLCDGSVLEFVVGSGFKGDNTYPEWTKGKIYRVEVLDAVNNGEGFKWDW